ncbi:MAG: hypothetical protein II529_05290, partial [Erysipelotrichaceae bacterium]|nr:hypothetical protein [Erysipelotrichaceae bacterium]
MKKLFTVLLALIITLIPLSSVKAEDEHVIVDDVGTYFSSASEYQLLNIELKQFSSDYHTGIYVVLDGSIDDVYTYAQNFLSSVDGDNVVLVVSGNNYYLEAEGTNASAILSAESSLFASYN